MTIERVTFTAHSGTKLSGILEDLTPSVSRVAVVLCHGFSSNKHTRFNRVLADRLAAHGVATLRFDFFGHGESEGAFEDITISEAIADGEAALAFLQTRGYVHLGFYGSSFGGLVGYHIAARRPDLFAVALKSPVADWPALKILDRDPDAWKRDGFALYTSHGAALRLHYALYPDAVAHIAYSCAASIRSPLCIVHGDADEIVPFEQSVRMHALIMHSELAVVPGADHLYTRAEHASRMLDVLVTFFLKHLPQLL